MIKTPQSFLARPKQCSGATAHEYGSDVGRRHQHELGDNLIAGRQERFWSVSIPGRDSRPAAITALVDGIMLVCSTAFRS